MADIHRTKALGFWNVTNTGTNAGVSATKSGAAGQAYVVESITASGDAAAVVTVEFPAGTIVYQKRFAAAFTLSEVFPPGCYTAPANTNAVVKVSASTSHCEANMAGYTIDVG